MIVIDYLNFILSLFFPLFLGYILVTNTFRSNNLNMLFAIPVSFGLGFGFLTQFMFILGVASTHINLYLIQIPIIIVSLMACHYRIKNNSRTFNTKDLIYSFRSIEPNNKIIYNLFCNSLFIILFLYFIYIFLLSFKIPLDGFDALATISFKAKVFHHWGTFQFNQYLNHPSYPLHLPLLETWITFHLGHWSDQLIKVIFPLTLLMYVLFHYKFVKELTSKSWALINICLITLSYNVFVHTMMGYRDLTFMFYNCSTILLLLQWDRTKKNEYLVLGALFSGFTTFVKLEGSGYLVIHIALLFCLLLTNKEFDIRQKAICFVRFLIPSFGLCLIFNLYKIVFEISSSERFAFDLTLDNLSFRLFAIVSNYLTSFFIHWNWGFVWFFFLLGMIFLFKIERTRVLNFILLAIFLSLGLHVSITLLTPNFKSFAGKDFVDVLPRLTLHYFPLVTAAVTLMFEKLYNCDE